MSAERPLPDPSEPLPESPTRDSGGGLPEHPKPVVPPLSGRGPKTGQALKRAAEPETPFTPEQRLLILDAWRRRGLPAGDFAPLVGLSKHTLYSWKKLFDADGPAGLLDKPRGGLAVAG